jgi:hypothetical protein
MGLSRIKLCRFAAELVGIQRSQALPLECACYFYRVLDLIIHYLKKILPCPRVRSIRILLYELVIGTC